MGNSKESLKRPGAPSGLFQTFESIKKLLREKATAPHNPKHDTKEVRKYKEKNPDSTDDCAPKAGDVWTCPKCGEKHMNGAKHCKCGGEVPENWVAESDKNAALLKWGLIIGISVLVVILITVGIFCVMRKKRRRPMPMMAHGPPCPPPGMSLTPGYSRTPGSSRYSSYYSGTPGYSVTPGYSRTPGYTRY